MTTVAMLALAVFLAVLFPADKKAKSGSFFDRDAAGSLRGFWCLIIALVHVPAQWQNPIQDLMGSFAYVGVTFFFMTSSYGLVQGVQTHGVEYLTHGFWRRRLRRLLIPMVMVNVLAFLAGGAVSGSWDVTRLLQITGFVRQLLLLYGLTWLVFVLPCERKQEILCLAVVLLSLALYVLPWNFFAWPVETLGYLYGILLAKYRTALCGFARKRWFWLCLCLCVACALLGAAYLSWKQTVFFGDYLLRAVLGAAITALVLAAHTKLPVGNFISRFLGRLSYEIYLLHEAVFLTLLAVFPQWTQGVMIVPALALTVAAAVAVNAAQHLFERKKTWQKN